LKRMLDKMEEAQDPVIFSCAGRELETVSSKIIDTIRSATALGAFIPTPTIVAAGLGLHKLSDKAAGIAAVELKAEADARSLDGNITRNLIARAAALLSKYLGTTVAHQGGTNSGAGAGGGGGIPGPPGFGGPGGGAPAPGGFGGGGGPGGAGPPMP